MLLGLISLGFEFTGNKVISTNQYDLAFPIASPLALVPRCPRGTRSSSCLFHSPSVRPHALRPCARQPRGCYFNWLWPFVMICATPQPFAYPCPCSGSACLMGRTRSSSPWHNRTHIGVCSPDTNRCAALVRILLDGSAKDTEQLSGPPISTFWPL